jgi:hypothetical protein
MNNHHNDNTPVYLIEKHTRLEEAQVSFFEFVISFFLHLRINFVNNFV